MEIGNESAVSTPVPLASGSAHFDQTMKLNVNMYYDEAKSKFVEKKVVINKYSVCIVLCWRLRREKNQQVMWLWILLNL